MDGSRRQRYVDKFDLLDLRCRQVADWTQGATPESLRADDRTRLAIYKALQECIEVSTDLCAMRLRDQGHTVKEDHANVDALLAVTDIDVATADFLHEANGLRNRLVHSYAQIHDDLTLSFAITRAEQFRVLSALRLLLELDQQISEDFAFLRDRVLGILRFGSSVTSGATARDIDICIVAPGQKPSELTLEVYRRIDVRGRNFDVWVFEELPVWMRHEVIEHHTVSWTNDLPALSEYLYFMRKPCLDMLARRRQAM